MSSRISRSDSEWKAQLSDLAYKVTRKGSTERAFSNDNFPKQHGQFYCVCCNAPLFSSDAKFDSGTGWPSFYQPLTQQAVQEREDNSWFSRRTEVICEACDAHLGHVFADGPAPSGLRYCMNGVALTFQADDEA